MSESDKGGPRSEAIAGKVEIEPRELRRILAHQFREEILGEVWSRVRRTFTLGGFISISVVLGFAAFLRGEIDSAATGAATTVARTEATQQVNLREDALRAAARDAARAEIRDNATDVERVKVELRNALAGLIDKALREDPFRGQIIEIVRPQLAQILQDDDWRRPIERAVFQQQALDTSRPVGARLFGFAAIVQERGGQAVALDILRTATERLQGAGASPNDIVFLRQAVATYAATLQPQPRAGAFREHEGILDALFDIAPAAGPEGSGFARLMREFDDPLAIAWLVRRIRQSSGEQRGVAIAALVSHSGQEARERVDTLLCSGEQELARAILQAYRSGQAAMTGDETGERFVRILNCSANYILAEYLPAVDERCLPGGDLLSFWRLSEYPDRNLRPEQQRRRNELVTSVAGRLRNIPDTCPPGLRGIAGSTPSFRQPLHWTALRQAPDDAPSPLLPYVALLRAPEGDDQPRWLSDLLRADGSLPALFADPSRHLVHIAVLLDRLATAPVAWGAAAAARDRLTATLVDMVGASPYRNQAERLLLAGMAGNAGPSFCGATLRAFGAKPHAALQAPAAFARSVRCALDPAEAPDVAALLQVMRGLAERDVTADLATWTIRTLSTGNNFAAVQADAANDANVIRAYLGEHGFTTADLQPAGISVNQWTNNGVDQIQVRQQFRLRTTKIADAKAAYAGQAVLLARGVALEDGGSSIAYSFTKLNDVKPAMIAEATKDARKGAEQFAKDSGASVGGIRSASQGYFSIQSRDGDSGGPADASPEQKVRVVTTVEFYLND